MSVNPLSVASAGLIAGGLASLAIGSNGFLWVALTPENGGNDSVKYAIGLRPDEKPKDRQPIMYQKTKQEMHQNLMGICMLAVGAGIVR